MGAGGGASGYTSAYTFVAFWWPGGVGWRPAGGDDGPLARGETGGPYLEPASAPVVLTPPLPAVWAEGIARRLDKHRAARTPEGAHRMVRRLLREVQRRWALTSARPFCPPSPPERGDWWERSDGWDEAALKGAVAGRRLLAREVYRRLLRRRGLREEDRPPGELGLLVAALFRLAEQGWGHALPGILWDDGDELRCARCGGREMAVWPCARCGQPCPECETCSSLGPVRGCDVLIAAREGEGAPAASLASPPPWPPGPEEPLREPSRLWGGDGERVRELPAGAGGALPPLSPAQEAAARALLQFIDGPGPREALVWAACGAGKTEVAFAAIRTVLERGGRVLFAVPRRDVVAELGRRLARYAAPFAVEVAYGGAPLPGGGREGAVAAAGPGEDVAPLVVATTHQCLRWGPRFHLVVLDEVDAFPYRAEPFLRRALLGTLATGGKLVTMTATPDAAHLWRARWGAVALVTIPARYHGHPLPVPRWIRDRGGPDGLGPAARRALAHAAARGPTLAFVPTVTQGEQVAAALRREPLLAGVPVEGIHSRDPRREDKLAAFREGRIRLLVATTVLERGITVPSAQVVVLFADDGRVFDAAALVQMAGRAGRSADDPDGLVYFVSRRRTAAMDRAVGQIRELNRRAARAGYLRPARSFGPSGGR